MPKKVNKNSDVSKAAKTLSSDQATPRAKSAASKVLTQAKAKKKVAAKKASSAAAKVLRDGKSSKAAKSAAATTLASGGRVVLTPHAKTTIRKSEIRRAVKTVVERKSKAAAKR